MTIKAPKADSGAAHFANPKPVDPLTTVKNSSAALKIAVKKRAGGKPATRHNVEFDENGNLLITLDRRIVAKIDGASFEKWFDRRDLVNRQIGLAIYLDRTRDKLRPRSSEHEFSSYFSHVRSWLIRERKKIIQRRASNSRNETKKDSKHIGENALHFSVMGDDKNNIKISGVDQAQEISALLEDICEAFPRSSDGEPLVKSQRLIAALDITLKAIRDHEFLRVVKVMSLPAEANEKYVPRQSGKASDFLIAQYGAYIEAGVCFRPDIKRLDPKLEMALRNEFKGRPESLRAILPNKADEVSARLEAAFGEAIAPEKRKLALQALNLAKAVKTPKL